MKKSLGGGVNLPHPNWNRVKKAASWMYATILNRPVRIDNFQESFKYLNPLTPGVRKRHTYLTKPAAFSFKFV